MCTYIRLQVKCVGFYTFIVVLVFNDFLFKTVPAPVAVNNEVNRTLQQGRVTYFELEIPEGGATLMVEVNNGRVLVCGSRSNQNPDCRDPSTYDFICETDGYCDIFVENDGSRKRRQTGGNTMFITIEGIERNNEIVMDVMMGDETISNGNLC